MKHQTTHEDDIVNELWNKFEQWYEMHPITRVLILLDAIVISLLYLVLT